MSEESFRKIPQQVKSYMVREISYLVDKWVKFPQLLGNLDVSHHRQDQESLNHQNLKSDGNSKIRKKYNHYSLDFKKKLVESIKEEMTNSNEQLSKIVRFKASILGIHPKNIHRWYKEGQNLRQKIGGRKPAYPKMQEKLFQFMMQNPNEKRHKIIEQAKDIMNQLGYTTEYGHNFHFSKGWYQRFITRKKKPHSKLKKLKKNELQDSSVSSHIDEQYINNFSISKVQQFTNNETIKNKIETSRTFIMEQIKQIEKEQIL